MSNEKQFFNDEKLYYSLTYEDTIQILNLIDDYQYRNLNIELGDLKLKVDKKGIKNNKANEFIEEESSRISNNETQEEESVSKTEENKAINDVQQEVDEKIESDTEKNDEVSDGSVPVQASITGVFYEAPSPGEEPYVKVGSEVKKGDELGLVEVMKLFNTIIAPCDGVVKEILVEDESVVNVEDILMKIDPT